MQRLDLLLCVTVLIVVCSGEISVIYYGGNYCVCSGEVWCLCYGGKF